MVFPVCQPDFTCEKKEFINISYQKRKKSENTGKPLAFFANFDYNRKELRISNKSHVSTGLTERKFTYEKTTKAIALLAASTMLAVSLTACGTPANTVFSADDLKGKKIGAQLGTTGYIYAGDVEDATVEPYNKGADAVQALKQGKLDAVIIDSEPAKAFVAKNDTLKILDDPFAEEEYAIAYKKGNDELGQKLDDALTKLKEDGTLDEIVSHWIGDNADQKSYTPDDSVERDGTLVMATNAEFPPYESVDGETIVGVDVDMMQAVCDEIGMELKVENMEFDSIIAAVQSGKADVGVAGMTVTPDREENVSFTQGYATTTQVIIVRKD